MIENQMEHKVENDMETGTIMASRTINVMFKVCLKYPVPSTTVVWVIIFKQLGLDFVFHSSCFGGAMISHGLRGWGLTIIIDYLSMCGVFSFVVTPNKTKQDRLLLVT